MMAIPTQFSDTPIAESALARIWSHAVKFLRHRRDLARDRREVRRLFDLNVGLLDDMGLERQDIAWALQGPSETLPSHRLRALRSQRSRERLERMRRLRR